MLPHLYFRDVPPVQREELYAFRAQYPATTVTVDGVPWEVIDTGPADSGTGNGTKADAVPLLILVGGLRMADAAFKTAGPLAEHLRVIVPSYPRLQTMAALCDGLAGLLDALGIQRAHVLAGSFGGMIAQVFVRRHPARVANMVLSATGIPEPGPYREQLQTMRLMPGFVLARFLPRRMLQVMAVADDQHAFWEAYLKELFMERLEKADTLATLLAILDFADNYSLAADDLAAWDGALLIIQSSDDATFDAESREAVQQLYPGAQFYLFTGAGHSPAQNQPHEYQRVVREFLGV